MATSRTRKTTAAQSMQKQILPLLVIAGGYVAGNIATNTIAKVTDKTGTATGIKKALPALAVIGAGAFAAYKFGANSMILNAAHGAAAAGMVKTAQALLPNTSFLGELDADSLLGLSPMSAAANSDAWVMPPTQVGDYGYPDLAGIEPPYGAGGYYNDAPAYMYGTEEDQMALPQSHSYSDDSIAGVDDVDAAMALL